MNWQRTFAVAMLALLVAAAAPAAELLPHRGVVVETIDVPNYTYVRVRTDYGDRWLATPRAQLVLGATVAWNDGMDLRDFHSTRLDRTFAEITFVGSVVEAAPDPR